jgi:hypothetical protein
VLDVRLPAALPADLARVCGDVAVRLRTGAVAVVVCHAESLPASWRRSRRWPGSALVARRSGAASAVRGMRPELTSLVELLGLEEPLRVRGGGPQ